MNISCLVVIPKPIFVNPNIYMNTILGKVPQNLGHKRIILSISTFIAIGLSIVIVIHLNSIILINLWACYSTF